VLQNVRAQNPVGFRVGYEFHDALEIVIRDRATARTEWKFADMIIDLLFLRLILSQSNTGQFRIRINDASDRVLIYMAILAGDSFHARNSFLRRFVS
jgi:hypothetical protein